MLDSPCFASETRCDEPRCPCRFIRTHSHTVSGSSLHFIQQKKCPCRDSNPGLRRSLRPLERILGARIMKVPVLERTEEVVSTTSLRPFERASSLTTRLQGLVMRTLECFKRVVIALPAERTAVLSAVSSNLFRYAQAGIALPGFEPGSREPESRILDH